MNKAVSEVLKRANVTAREARDIVTALGSVGKLVTTKYVDDYYGGKGRAGETLKAIKDLKKQIKEVPRAAATGKKGTRAGMALGLGGESTYAYTDKWYKGSKKGDYKAVPKQRGKRK